MCEELPKLRHVVRAEWMDSQTQSEILSEWVSVLLRVLWAEISRCFEGIAGMGCPAVNMCPEAEAARGSVRMWHLENSAKWAPSSLGCHQCREHQASYMTFGDVIFLSNLSWVCGEALRFFKGFKSSTRVLNITDLQGWALRKSHRPYDRLHCKCFPGNG